MQSDPPERWLEVEPKGDIAVVRFLQPRILDEEIIDYIGQELLRLVDKEGCRKMVLDFRQVDAMATHMLGELLVLHKKIQAAGGRLALCEFRPHLREVFEVLKLTQVFHMYESETAAMQSFLS
jgi:anti-sigma B factor antagonist